MALSFPFSANRHTSIIFCFLSLFAISFFKGVPVYGEKRAHYKSYHVVNVKSLHPNPNYCIESTKDQSKRESLKVVHRHGPCSHLNQDKATTPTFAEILSNDKSRVDSLQSRLGTNSARNNLKGSKATLPAKPSLDSGIYIATLGIGTPKQDLNFLIDTGSDLTWIQCKPCTSCDNQKEPIFNPSTSQTYKSLGCGTQCTHVYGTGFSTACTSGTCSYEAYYHDNSSSMGLLATETLTLTPSDIFPNFTFGCGSNDAGTAGLLGLGQNNISLLGQTASKYGNYFSYCLPTFSSSSGTLVIGKGGGTTNSAASLKYTKLSTSYHFRNSYFIEVVGIKVGGKKLNISSSVFRNPGTIIDSGTVITRLQPMAYATLRTRFRNLMKNYKRSQDNGQLFDTCYDVSSHETMEVPPISFIFGRFGGVNVEVPIAKDGIMYNDNQASVSCLAFAGNSDASDVGIFGAVQQQTLNVVYDVDGGKLGFGIGGCS